MSYFTSQFIAKITHSLGQQLWGSIRQFLVLFLFILFSFFLLNLFDFKLYHIESIEYTVSICSILIDIIWGKDFPRSFEVIFDKIDHCKYETHSQKESYKDSRYQNDNVSGIIKSWQFYKDIAGHNIACDILKNKYILSSLPLSLNSITSIVIETFCTPTQIVNSGKCKHLQ